MTCDLSISQSSVGAPCTIPVNVANAVLQPCMGHTGTTLNDGLTCYTQCEMDYVPCPSQLFCRQGGGHAQTRTCAWTGVLLATATPWTPQRINLSCTMSAGCGLLGLEGWKLNARHQIMLISESAAKESAPTTASSPCTTAPVARPFVYSSFSHCGVGA